MGLLELFTTACMPVLNMLLVTGVGSFLASDFAAILTKEARNHLNNLVFYVFNPCLIASYLAKTITLKSFGKLWFMPVNIFLTFIFGLIFGWIVILVTRPPAKLRGLILGCCSSEMGSPFGPPDACQTYGLAYSSLSLAQLGAVFLWTVVYNIIRVASEADAGSSNDARTNQAEVSDSGVAAGPVSEGTCSTSSANELLRLLEFYSIRSILKFLSWSRE